MEKFDVTGMSCAACSARVEKAVSKLDGIESCSVNLLTNSMAVEGNVSPETIISAVQDVGYGAALQGSNSDNSYDNVRTKSNEKEEQQKKEFKVLKLRLISSVAILIFLMYFTMGYTMFSKYFPLPQFFVENSLAVGLIEMLLAAIVMVINQKFFISGFKGIIKRSPNMDTLVSLGSISAFLYSTVMLFVMIPIKDSEHGFHFLHELYFESAAMVLALITIGKLLESKAKGKTTNALKSLMKLAPQTATLIQNGKSVVVPVSKVKRGDIFAVKPGESVPVDGIVIKGSSTVNESALTGESLPVDKEIDDNVSAGTVNQSGYIECEAKRVGEDTTLAQIIQVVNDASASKAPIAKVADKVSGVFVPVVISIAVVTFIIWMCVGQTFGYSLARAISVLVISCPCALGLATPVAIMVGSGVGARNGVLFKTATSLEVTGKAKIIALDKTGTITLGEPRVTDIIPMGEATREELLQIAATLEKNSEHPLAKAIMFYAQENNIRSFETESFEALSGSGVVASVKGVKLYGGNKKLMQERLSLSGDVLEKADYFAEEGKTPLYFSKGDELLGIIAVADVIKDDSFNAIENFKNMGMRVVMLTGDNGKTAEAIGKKAGVDEVISDVLPGEKEKVIRELQKDGQVIMVGDGINDAPALTRADIGIAVGSGTDIAVDSADVIIIKSKLSDVVSAIKLSRAVIRNIHENLCWAFGYNIVGIPLAAGAFVNLLGWSMNPMFGAAAMSLSSFLVVSNALRLNFVKLGNKPNNDIVNNNLKQDIKETEKMKKTVKLEGMMCPHCEAKMKEIFEKIPEVDLAEPNHKKKKAVLTLNSDIEDAKLQSAVEKAGYKFIGVEDGEKKGLFNR